MLKKSKLFELRKAFLTLNIQLMVLKIKTTKNIKYVDIINLKMVKIKENKYTKNFSIYVQMLAVNNSSYYK